MKSTLKIFVLMLCMACLAGSASAQGDAKREKIDAYRATYIAKHVAFTTQESQAFWPLYNEMSDKQEAARKTFRTQYNAKTDYNFQTDKEAEAYVNAELLLRQKEYEIYKEYFDKFKKILPVKKVAALRRAEEDFKKEVMEIIKKN